ncbi:MAG TPA: AMP-binding protein [Polyangia bacterium]|jgi:amino acid adenylation domain-containing protein
MSLRRAPVMVDDLLRDAAAREPDHVALIVGEERITYGELDARVSRCAAAFAAAGLLPRDRIAIQLPNSIDTVVTIFGAARAGAAFLVLHPSTKPDKLAYVLANCAAKAFVSRDAELRFLGEVRAEVPTLGPVFTVGQGPLPDSAGEQVYRFADALAAAPDRPPRTPRVDLDLAALIYTSGSTGKPKGVMHTHGSLRAATLAVVEYLENTRDDVCLDVLPLSFGYGLIQVLCAACAGATVVLERGFSFAFPIIEAIMKHRVTGFAGVPTIYALLLELRELEKHDLSSLRYYTNAAGPLPPAHMDRLRQVFPRARLYSMYGQTECIRSSFLPPDELDRRPRSVGKGIPNQEHWVENEDGRPVQPGEVGELVIRGAHVMRGYWAAPEATAKVLKPGRYPGEVVYYSGDLFTVDEDGFLFFVSRKDDIIKCRGEKVAPREVENVLHAHPAVLEAAVIGVPDPILGEAVKAYVVPREGATVVPKELLGYVKANLEDFMVPKEIELREALPKTPSGKVCKSDLRAEVRARAAGAAPAAPAAAAPAPGATPSRTNPESA